MKNMHFNKITSRLKSILSEAHILNVSSQHSNLPKQFSSLPLGKNVSKAKKIFNVFAGITGTSCVVYALYKIKVDEVKALTKAEPQKFLVGSPQSSLPCYSLEDVSKHKDIKSRIWVTFNQGVYDITEFVEMHPGGEIILKAAGASIEPFWLMYGVHLNEHVFEILETYRIGNISVEDSKLAVKGISTDPYAMEPPRDPLLKPASIKPFNAEPPPYLLVESFLTPAEIFYVRNHLPVPVVNEDSYRLCIEGKYVQKTEISLVELKKLPSVTVTAAVMCAGNRRSEMTQIKPVKGLSWGHAAIGNATWTGVRLVDVLKLAGLPRDALDKDIEHIHFEGLDVDINKTPYAASIPADKALDPRGDVILAYEMNGEPLNRDHGAPLRAIVPGVVGARNVKWLGKIILSEKESTSHWQQNDYKGFSPSTDWDTVDFSKSPAIQELPVISAICKPIDNDSVKLNKNNELEIEGYAWSGGGKAIVRVDVTLDQGKTWHVANFTAQDKHAKLTRNWGWTLWSVKIPVQDKRKNIEIWAKAVDSSYNTQPESFSNIWNLRGVLDNAYHRVKVECTR